MVLEHVSASQVETFDRCPRRWFNRSILKIRSPQTAAQKRGSDIHKAIENYLQGAPFDQEWQQLVQSAVHLLPKPNDKNTLIEHEVNLVTYEGGPNWTGYIDLLEFEREPILITDYKTTSDFKWSKTADQLRKNTQLCAYSKYVFVTEPAAHEVDIRHVNIRTRGSPKAQEVVTRLDRNAVEEVWQRDMKTVKEMVAWAARDVKDANELPPNTDACGDFGGCEFRDKCGFSSIQRLFQIQTKKKDDMTTAPKGITLSERLALRKAAEAAGGAPPAPTPTPTPHPFAIILVMLLYTFFNP